MPQHIQAPDGSVVEFPDGMDDRAISAVMARNFPAPKAQKQSGNTSQALGFEQGVGNFLGNAADLAGKVPGVSPAFQYLTGHSLSDSTNALRNPANPEGNKPGAIGRFGADMLETAPTMLGGPLTGGAASGFLLRDSNKPEDMAASTAAGAAGGKLGDILMRGAARVVAPQVSKYAKALMDEGVRLTPGQILGGGAQKLEDKITSVPFLGDMVSNARIRGLQDFNTAAINRSLAPIGKALPDGVMGRDAVDAAHTALSDNYTSLLKGATFKVDPTFTQNVGSLTSLAQNIPQYGSKPLQDFIATNIATRISKAGSMSGGAFKEVDSLLGQEAKNYSSSPSPNDRKLGDAFWQLKAELKDALGRSNPAIQKGLEDTDAGYANLVRIENAAARGGGAKGVDPGVFTPSQLASAVRATDSSVRKNAVARGGALMQDLSDAGQAVLPSQVPDSGTPGRLATMLLAGSGAAHMLNPAATAAVPAFMGAYTQPGVKAAEFLLAKRPQGAGALAKALRNHSKAAALPAAAGATALAQQLYGSDQ